MDAWQGALLWRAAEVLVTFQEEEVLEKHLGSSVEEAVLLVYLKEEVVEEAFFSPEEVVEEVGHPA